MKQFKEKLSCLVFVTSKVKSFKKKNNSQRTDAPTTPPSACYRCGGLHWNKDCKYLSTTVCNKCKNKGHFSRICKTSKKNSTSFKKCKQRLHSRPEDIFATLNGGKVFSQLDLSDSYFEIKLDKPFKTLCSMNTHRGTFEFLRLPFGVKSASEIF